MIVYRGAARRASASRWLGRIARELDDRRAASADHDAVRELVIELGALEAAVSDALHPEADDVHELDVALREITVLAAHALRLSWDGADAPALAGALERVRLAVGTLARARLPRLVHAGVPEGYAYYGLYPEGYLEAARRLARELRPERAMCVGIRGIGTSLAAAARAALEGEGCRARSWSVRPRGAPFAREVALAPALRDEMRAHADALWLVADEGPGLSGSSFAAVAAALSALGVPDERIVLLPSWTPGGERFVSDEARRRWARHRKVVVSFEEAFLASGRLARVLGGGELVDISAGDWRRLWYGDAQRWPATHPQHERRKFLLAPARAAERLRTESGRAPLAAAARDGARVVKFAGLGRFGRATVDRARRLASAGFAPAPIACAHGFVVSDLVPGVPLAPGQGTPGLVERVARYLAFVALEFRTGELARRDELARLIAVNAAEALGSPHAAAVARVARLGESLGDTAAVWLDARLMPHEWLVHDGALLKTDATDHHDDHFYPGAQDPAWDLAGAMVELALAPADSAALVARYRALTGDRRIGERLPFHRVAYLAHRLGYATLAMDTLSGTAEAARWRPVARRYAALLGRAIARGAHAA
ncbi:MAG TPA: hypothetical protein VFS44_11170 [Gemmatimonadaceae bacterium]|nr:hypothetical protein [Gemmatimonadaceae bacterium]